MHNIFQFKRAFIYLHKQQSPNSNARKLGRKSFVTKFICWKIRKCTSQTWITILTKDLFNISKLLNFWSLIWNLLYCAITLSFLRINTDQNNGSHIADTAIFPPPPTPHPNFPSQYDSKIFSSCFAAPVFNSVADAVQTNDTSHPPPSKPAFTSPRAALSSFRHLARTKAHSWYGIRTSSTSQWCSHSASFP